ncbi:hypothetical protein T265_02539 [Opisthorchis viverrini]|uniref:Uncharacterized protein n=1 Tax=Opisthorchis viverrini TaxID=6198 RepID=A0A074ZUV5_OPIVI|nr:hypothetical protein T265_02539 [Opisthorchis viverrini]KER31223.1 hypothetical protein T265_02539 [Opisthorchis viverrini]
MSDSDHNSSFEVVEEETISLITESSIETIGHDRLNETESDGVWNVCVCSHAVGPDKTDTVSTPDTSEHSERSWVKTPSIIGTQTESNYPENALVLRAPLRTERAKLPYRRTRKRPGKQLSLSEPHESQALPVITVTHGSHGKLLLGVICLFGLVIGRSVSFNLFDLNTIFSPPLHSLSTIGIRTYQLNSFSTLMCLPDLFIQQQISLLEGELARMRLQHETELRQEYEKHAEQDTKSRALILDLQKERHQLLNDLQIQLERQASRETQARETILELQTERMKLMDTVSSAKLNDHRSGTAKLNCKELKARNSLLEKQLRETRNELRDMKHAFLELEKRSCLPGMKFINWVLCKGLRLCPDHFL